MKIDSGFAVDLIARAAQAGTDQAEVFVRSSKNLSIEVKNQEIDVLSSSLSFGYSLRVLKGGRSGFSYSTDINEADTVIKRAVETAPFTDEDRFVDFPCNSDAPDINVSDPLISGIREEDAIRMTMELESAALGLDSRIRKVRKASGSFTFSETVIANSKGVLRQYPSTGCVAQISALAEEGGESQIAWEFEGSRFLHEVSFESVGRKAASRALSMLGSRKKEGARMDIVLDNSVAVDFLDIIASALSSEAVQKGKSLLKDRQNTRIMSQHLNVIDSGLISGCLGSRPVDDEGVPVLKKTLVREGVLEGFLYNTYTANKGGVASTGNAVRGGFASIPGVGRTNLYLETAVKNLTVSREELIRSLGRGLLIMDAMGVHTANPVSGDFSVGVTGLWVEAGQICYPVKEAVFSGNILDIFGKIQGIGDDLKFFGSIGSPSLLVSSVDISA